MEKTAFIVPNLVALLLKNTDVQLKLIHLSKKLVDSCMLAFVAKIVVYIGKKTFGQ